MEHTRDIRRLSRIPGIGPALAGDLVARGIRTKAGLRKIISELPRETQAHLRHIVTSEIPLAEAESIVHAFRKQLVFTDSDGKTKRYPTIAVGSVRRKAPISKDIDLLVVVPDGTPLAGVLGSAVLRKGPISLSETYASGTRRRSLIAQKGNSYYAVDLFLTTQSEKPFAIFHYSNGRSYNIRIRAYAKRKGWKLDQYGLFNASTNKRAPGSRAIKTERDLAAFLGVTYHPPEERA